MKFKRKQQNEQVALYQQRLAKPQKKPLPEVAPPPPPPKPDHPALGSVWLVKNREDGPKYKVINIDKGVLRVELEWFSGLYNHTRTAWVGFDNFDKTTGFLIAFEMENV